MPKKLIGPRHMNPTPTPNQSFQLVRTISGPRDVYVTQAGTIDLKDLYPQKCPCCGSAAFTGAFSTSCSNRDCQNADDVALGKRVPDISKCPSFAASHKPPQDMTAAELTDGNTISSLVVEDIDLSHVTFDEKHMNLGKHKASLGTARIAFPPLSPADADAVKNFQKGVYDSVKKAMKKAVDDPT